MRQYHPTSLRNEHRRYERQLIRYEALTASGSQLVPPRPPPPPPVTPKPRPPGALIGFDTRTHEELYVSAKHIVGGLFLLGKNGTGKTVTIRRLAGQDMLEDRGILVLDAHGDLTDQLLQQVPPHRTDDVVFLDVAHPTHAWGINPLWCPDPTNEALIAKLGDELHDIFKQVWADSWGAFLDDLIPNAAYTLLANPGYSMVELPRVFTDAAFRAKLIRNVPAVIRDFWENEYDVRSDAGQRTLFRSTLSRVRKFVRNPLLRQVLGQAVPTVDFPRLIADRKIVLVKMSVKDLGDENVSLFGSLVLRQIMNAAFARLELPVADRHQVILYADEYQRYASADFGTLIREARKTGLTPVLAHQDRDQIEAKLRKAPFAARSIICLQVTSDDARDVVEEFDCTPAPSTRPVADPLSYIERRGHPNPRALTLVHDLKEILDFATARVAGFLQHHQRGGYSQRLNAIKARITNASTRLLLAAIRQEDYQGEHFAADLDHALSLLEDYGEEMGLYRSSLLQLCRLLAHEPLYDPTDRASRSEMKDDLRTALTHLQPLTAYCKLQQDDETLVERFVTILLPPAVEQTPQLREQQARIWEQFCTIYGRLRTEVDRDIEKRQHNRQQTSGWNTPLDDIGMDEASPSTSRWEELLPSS